MAGLLYRSPAVIRLLALGCAELHGAEGQSLDAVLAQPKRFALLFYLATNGAGFHRRDILFDLFWRGADQPAARASLNQSIYFLRTELGRDAIVSRGNDEVAIEASLVWCDTTAFEAALEAGEPRAALKMYGGELLPGFFLSEAPGWERWLDGERERLRALAAAAGRALADAALARGDAVEAVRWARRTVAILPYAEGELRRLLALLSRIGDRTGAAKAYEEAAARFAADYEGELSATTRGLMDRILAGEVEEVDHDEGLPVVETTASISASADERPVIAPGDDAHSGRRTRYRWLVAVVVVVAAAFLGVAMLHLRDAGTPPTEAVSSIPATADRLAVLPLTGPTLDSAEAYLADAMTDGLIRRLSDVAGLGVIAWMSVEPLREGRLSAVETGERLGARYLLEGTLRPVDGGVQLEARLVEAAPGTILWAGRFEGSPEEIAAMEGQIAVEVARTLSIDLDADQRARLSDPGTDDPAARRAYLEGRHLLSKTDEGSLREALASFRTAVDRDPAYALAWSGMSDAYDHLAGIGAMPSAEAYSRARSAAERALDIDPNLAEAHSSLAMALSHHYWMSEDAERHWRRALELNPSDARARRTYAGHLRNLGRFEQAEAHATVARDLDPIPFFSHFELLVIPYFKRHHDEVIERAAHLAATDPSYAFAHFFRALALVQLNRYDDALAALDELDPHGRIPDARLIRGYIAGRRGDTAAARAELQRFEQGTSPESRGFERAILYLSIDDHDGALAALEDAYAAPQWRLRLLGYEPLFDPLRGDPRFQGLLDRIGVGATEAE